MAEYLPSLRCILCHLLSPDLPALLCTFSVTPCRIKQHTYANRYDAGFIFEALWKKRYKDATGRFHNRVLTCLFWHVLFACRIGLERLLTQCVWEFSGKRVPGQCCPEVRIPDTVIYKSGYPAQWYFQSKQEKGKILRKNKRSLTIPKIYDSMAAWNGICESQVCLSVCLPVCELCVCL